MFAGKVLQRSYISADAVRSAVLRKLRTNHDWNLGFKSLYLPTLQERVALESEIL